METFISNSEDALIDSLSFKLPNSANFVTDRKSVSFYPSNGTEYVPRGGTNLIRFNLTGTDWLDPSSVRFFI